MKRVVRLMILTVLVLLVSACSVVEKDREENGTQQEIQDNAVVEAEKESDDAEEPKEEVTNVPSEDTDGMGDTSTENVVSVTVYFSNDDATAFTSEEVSIPSFSPEEVLNALISKGAVAADVKVLSFETLQLEGKETIELDLNEAFSTYVSSMGTTGEYYVIGSICNTFLEAYDCEQIKITVEGEDLETGHAEYPGYMTRFE